MALLAPDLVPVSLLMLMIPLNVYVAWREWEALDRSGVTWTTVGRFLGTFSGLWLLTTLTSSLLNVLIGAVSVLAAIATLIAPSFTPDRRALVAAGVITGLPRRRPGSEVRRLRWSISIKAQLGYAPRSLSAFWWAS